MAAAESQPSVEGSTGQLRPHPGFGVAARCDVLAVKLTEELRQAGTEKPPDSFRPARPVCRATVRRAPPVGCFIARPDAVFTPAAAERQKATWMGSRLGPEFPDSLTCTRAPARVAPQDGR